MDKEELYEEFLGIRTSDEEVLIGNRDQGQYSSYEASEYEGLIKIFDEVKLEPTDTVVDFGCGMGRVLFFCNQRFLCNVTGIEYDKGIYERLVDNAEYYHVRFKDQRKKFCLLNMKAEEYVVEKKDNIFYMFNPFSVDILENILEKIIASGKENPREITLILYYCTYDMMSTVRKYPFTLDKIIKLPAYILDPDEKAYVYKLYLEDKCF